MKIIYINYISYQKSQFMIENIDKSYCQNTIKTYEKYQPIECRICYQNISNQCQQQYCLCSGNLKFVHQQCLIKWISQAKTFEQGNNRYCYCQVCKGRILLKTENKFEVRPLKQIFQNVFCCQKLEDRVKRIVFFLLILVMLATQIILIEIIVTDQSRRGTKLVIALLAINSFFFVIGTIYFSVLHVFQKKLKITGIRGLHYKISKQKQGQSQTILQN